MTTAGVGDERGPEEEPFCAACSVMGGGDGRKAGVGLSGARAAGGVDAWWRAAMAEAVGAAGLVALGCLPVCAVNPPPAVHAALAAGALVALLVQAFDHVSGAMFNPTVTLTALWWGRMSLLRGLVLVMAQLAGAAGGAIVLQLWAARPEACVTVPAAELSAGQAVALEAVLGAALALVNCASWDARNAGLADSWPLRIGTTVTALSLIVGDLTGASGNPARSFGPALVGRRWERHWVYWVGPLGGALSAAALYGTAWRAPDAAPPRTAGARIFTACAVK